MFRQVKTRHADPAVRHPAIHVDARMIQLLDRPERGTEEKPDRLVELLDLAPDTVSADIGAGSGYLTFRLQPRVPQGKVLAVDIQQEMLEALESRREALGAQNVETVVGTVTNPGLAPNALTRRSWSTPTLAAHPDLPQASRLSGAADNRPGAVSWHRRNQSESQPR